MQSLRFFNYFPRCEVKIHVFERYTVISDRHRTTGLKNLNGLCNDYRTIDGPKSTKNWWKKTICCVFFKFISETDSSIFNLFPLLQPYNMYNTEWSTFQNTHWLGIPVFDKKLVWFWKKNWHDFKIGGRK